MNVKKLFVIDNTLALEVPNDIKYLRDAVDYLRPALSSKEFISKMHENDLESWVDENFVKEDGLIFSDFRLKSTEYHYGWCQWTFISNEEGLQFIVDKSVGFVELFIF